LGYEPNELPDCSTPRQRKPIVTRTLSSVNVRTAVNAAPVVLHVAPWVHQLPAAMPGAVNRATRKPEEMAKILVVEDNDDVREMMAVTLELEGHQVQTAANGRDALEQLRGGEKPCVILLDLMMPVMNGWEFRREIERDAALADVPVIVISAATGELVRKTRADAVLPKPIDMDQLLDVVGDFCDGRRGRP
jgi:CheY-like chemotaxis protein